MTIFAEEILTTNASTPIQFSRTIYDVMGGTRAARAIVVVKSQPIFYGFISTPTALNGYKAVADQEIEINGYDNIRNFMALAQATAGTIYVNYLN